MPIPNAISPCHNDVPAMMTPMIQVTTGTAWSADSQKQ